MATTDRRGVSVDATDTPIAGGPNPGLAMKAPARVATTTNVTLSGLQTIDGVALADGDRVLVTGQTDGRQNGLYNASSGPWTRTIDASSNDEWASGLAVRVASGTTRGGYVFRVTTADPIVVDTSAINFSAAVSAPQFTGGTLSGATIDNSNTVALKDSLFTLEDDADATKRAKFQLSGVTEGQTRTLTVPDVNTVLVGTDATQTLTNKTIDGGNNTLTNIALASLAAIGAATLLGNPTAAGAHPEQFTVQSLSELLTPHFASDFFLAYDHNTGEFRKVAPKNLAPQFSVDTIAALKALDKTSHALVMVNGYYASGDCRPRVYRYDPADTTSADNGGTIIVASDGGRWKLIGGISFKIFGAAENGTAQDTPVSAAMSYGAANGVPVEVDGNFMVNGVTMTGISGLHLVWLGSLVGISSTAQDCVLGFVNCTDITWSGRPIINGSWNTNYTCGVHFSTTGAGQSISLIDITNPIVVGCKTAWLFGSASRPSDLISEVNIRGGYHYGCPQVWKAIGSNTVVNFSNCNLLSDFNGGSGAWLSLPTTGGEAVGATVHITGGNFEATNVTTNSLMKITAIASGTSLGNIYGNISLVNVVVECANPLLFTDSASLSAPIRGRFTYEGGNFVTTHDVADFIQLDALFTGDVVMLSPYGHAELAGGATRTFNNVTAANAAARICVGMTTFGPGFKQGYAGLSGGTQFVVGEAISMTERVVTGTSATQAANDSYIVFATSGTCTVTMLDPARFPGRRVAFRNAGVNAINSASSNINSVAGTPGTAILPAASGKFVVLRASGSLWQVESAN